MNRVVQVQIIILRTDIHPALSISSVRVPQTKDEVHAGGQGRERQTDYHPLSQNTMDCNSRGTSCLLQSYKVWWSILVVPVV